MPATWSASVGVRPGFFVLQILDGVVEFGFQALLPGGVERGVDVQPAELDVAVVEDAVEFAADGLERVGGLGFALLVVDQFDRLGGDGVAAGLVDEAHGDHAVERLVALFDGGVEIAERREDVRAADDADDQRALAVVEIAGGFAEVGAGRLLDAVRAGTEVDAVQVVGEDLVLRVAGLDAQGEGDFEKLPVQGFLLHLEAVARELHAQGGGALGEVPVLDVSNGRAGQAADVHAAVLEKPRVLAGAQRFHQEIRDVRAVDELAAGAAGRGDFHALAIVERGAGGQLGDLVQIEAHRQHEVEKREADRTTRPSSESWNSRRTGPCSHSGSQRFQNGGGLMGRQVDMGGVEIGD